MRTSNALRLQNFGKLKPVRTEACLGVIMPANRLKWAGFLTRTNIRGMSSRASSPDSILSAKKSRCSRMFFSACGRSSSLMASSQHITSDVTASLRCSTFSLMSFVPGMYRVAPRQYWSVSRSVCLLNSAGALTKLNDGL